MKTITKVKALEEVRQILQALEDLGTEVRAAGLVREDWLDPIIDSMQALGPVLESGEAGAIEETAIRYWREEHGDYPDGPLYGWPADGSPLERWKSLGEFDRQYYRNLVESE